MRRVLTGSALLLALAWPCVAHAAGDPLRSRQWALDMIGADAAHAVSTGEGALVAVIDSGVDAGHPDLRGRLLPGYDFVDSDDVPQDGNGHGTHVAGIIAADANNGIGIEGVAPDAILLPIRVLDDDGVGSIASIAAAVDYAISHGADVINLSLGDALLPTSALGLQPALEQAIRRALARQVVVVAAAGNSSLPVCDQPAAAGILCVGAVDRQGTHPLFSNFGLGLGLVAPGGSSSEEGEGVLSTYKGGGYRELAGTSPAAPQVAGVAALLVSLGVRGAAATARILATATDVGLPGPDLIYGAGIVNAAAAVRGLARPAPAPSPSPAPRASVRVATVQRIAAVLRRGILVRCTAPASGRCRGVASVRARRIAAGSRALAPGLPVTLPLPLTPAGRRLVRGAHSVRVRVRVTLPGAAATNRTILLRR